MILGAVTLIIEIAGSRLIAPYYGSSLYVWSSLITSAMGALASGYWLGGILSQKRFTFRNIFYLISFTGFWVGILPFVAPYLLQISNIFGIVYGPLVATLLLFFLPITLIGSITPLLVSIKTDTLTSVGITAGNLYASGTVGSLVGAYMTGFILAPNLEVKTIFVGTGIMLMSLHLIWQVLLYERS